MQALLNVAPPPPPPVIRQPDSLIKNTGETTYVGDNIYNIDGANQSRTQTIIAPGGSQVIRAVITTARNLIIGATKDFLITSVSVADAAKRDSVKATVKIN